MAGKSTSHLSGGRLLWDDLIRSSSWRWQATCSVLTGPICSPLSLIFHCSYVPP